MDAIRPEAVMPQARWILAIFCCLVGASVAQAQSPERIDALVRKLGSDSFVQREQAGKELEAIGPAALEPLRRAAKTSDAETARRIAELIARFEEQVLTKQILTPKEIDLRLDGVTVQQAITEISSKSGYAIQFQGDATPFADKKITLTGKMAFWQAFDKLCDQAGLMEMVDLTPTPQTMSAGKRTMRGIPAQPTVTSPIRLKLRGEEKSLVSQAGSVKIEARISRDTQSKDLLLTLIVSAEPSLLNTAVAGRAAFAKLLDDKDRTLKATPHVAAQPPDQYFAMGDAFVTWGVPRCAQFSINDANTPKQIKEIVGNLPLQLDLQNVVLAKMERIMDSAGKSVAGANGGSLKVESVKKLPSDAIEIQVNVENLTQNPFGNNIIINGGNVMIRGNLNGNIVINRGNVRVNGANNSKDLPDLLDAKGQKFKVGSVANDSVSLVNGSSSRNATIVFQPNPGQAEPRDLVLYGTRTHTIAVPFRFENVPLP